MPKKDYLEDKTIEKILLETHYIENDDVETAKGLAETNHVSLFDALVSGGLLTSSLIGQAISESLNVPYFDVAQVTIGEYKESVLPEETAKELSAVVVLEDEKKVQIASSDPKNSALQEALKMLYPQKQVVVGFAYQGDIEKALVAFRKPLETRFASIIENGNQFAPELINQLLQDAIALRASDIHLEPHEEEVVIRFRIDGILHEADRLEKRYYENVLNRIKVQAHLRIDEHQTTQDGAIRLTIHDVPVDLRVSVVPTLEGEKIVIRLLTSSIRGFSLNELGLSIRNVETLRRSSKKPFGMILVVGPTGSGKTTTLYGILRTLNSTQLNVTTIEDPVEYRLVGVNQIQVNKDTNLTFATGLRAIVRQDPNIILVGEIRDEETAEIAVNAALTGHLLLSTFHANDAATAIPRLLDMNIEPFLLASTLELIVAQRLVRRICHSCRTSVKLTRQAIDAIHPHASAFFSEKETYYVGKGCTTCNMSGYSGRSAVFEAIHVTQTIQDLISKRPSGNAIFTLARSQGMLTMFEDGMDKVLNGLTTIEELFRVTIPPEEIIGKSRRSVKTKKQPTKAKTYAKGAKAKKAKGKK